MVGLSRRRFLGAAGALLAVLLSGCGRDAARRPPRSDSDVLADVLRTELAAGAAVAGVAGARAIARQDELHAARLAQVAGIALGERSTAAADLPTALERKQEAVFEYVNVLPRLSQPDLRVLLMQIAASEAGHLVALRLRAGEEPVPDAFAGFTGAAAR